MDIWQLLRTDWTLEGGCTYTVEALFINKPTALDFSVHGINTFTPDKLKTLVDTGECMTYSGQCDEVSYSLLEIELFEN